MAGAKKTVQLSDESVNSYGFRLLTSGCDLSQFEKNPVMLYAHDNWDHLPIGKWENVTLSDSKLLADTDFDIEDSFAAEISRKVEKGYIKMASVGITPIEYSDDPKLMVAGQTGPTITKWKLREASIVPFGSNQNALVQLYDADGAKIEMTDANIISLFEGKKTIITQQKIEMKEIAKTLKLADSASEAEMVSAINLLEKRAIDAEQKLAEKEQAEKTARQAEVTSLLAEAKRDGRIDEKTEAVFVKLFDADFASAKVALAGIPKPKTITGALAAGEKADLGDKSTWDWDKWQKEDSKGLELMQKNDPEAFQALYDAKYKK